MSNARNDYADTCLICGGDGYLDESTLSRPLCCYCEAGRQAWNRDNPCTRHDEDVPLLPVYCISCGRRTELDHYVEVEGVVQQPICKACHGRFMVSHNGKGTP